MTTPAALAKGALRRLAQTQQEPTPENYARAYAEESGQPPPAAGAAVNDNAQADAKLQGAAWATLVERLSRSLDRGGRQWTAARRKESLKRVLEGSRSDSARLLQRLQSLMTAWESDQPSDPAQTGAEDPPIEGALTTGDAAAWPAVAATLEGTVRAGLPPAEPRAADLAAQLSTLADALASEGATPERAAQIDAVCQQARRLFAHRHHLIDELGRLCLELGAGITELAEDDSWARGQCQTLQARLGDMQDGISVRGVRAASTLLAETRQHQQQVRQQRQAARNALKQLLQDMLQEVDVLGEHAGRFESTTARHAEAIANADSLHSLSGAVKALLDDTRVVRSAVRQSQDRLAADRTRADELENKVRELEGELRRLSDEVSTDALTQVANRRGLAQAFESEAARAQRAEGHAAWLSVALIDIDNFKKLNDSLGHGAGDQALKALAGAVRERLRPADHLARYGGEEFVVLLPATGADEGQAMLTRLQRSLTEALFLHENREVFVTFSAGVTLWQPGEPLQSALERADEALYEAKRAGKNRTCIA